MAGNSEPNIVELGAELTRLRRRAALQRRVIEARPGAWEQWSSTMDEVAQLTDQLTTIPASDLESLAIKFRVILWLIKTNETLLDDSDLRRLRRFGRDLDHLAGL